MLKKMLADRLHKNRYPCQGFIFWLLWKI